MKQKIKTYMGKSRMDAGLLILRIGIGLQFALHGLPKITGGPALWEKLGASMSLIKLDFAPTFWGFMAAFAEFGGGIFIISGLFTRPAAALSAFTMLIAALHHWSEVYNLPELTFLNKWMEGSHALELMVVCLALYFTGPGKYSLDNKIHH